METAKKFLRELKDEYKDAEKYLKCYEKYKDTNSMWANEYLGLASQEMSHFEKIKAMAKQYAIEHPDIKPVLELAIELLFEDATELKKKLR